MKKRTLFLFVLLVFLASGCTKNPPAETLPVETEPAVSLPTVPAATEPEVPELKMGIAEINAVPAVLTTLSRGDAVDVVDRFDENHFVVKLEQGYGLVEQNLIRMDSEPVFEPWTGYAAHKAPVYDNFRLMGTALQILDSNAEVEVIEDLKHCYLVRYDTITGYMMPEAVRRTRQNDSGNDIPPSGGADGGDINLQHQSGITLLSVITPQQGSVSGQATVLADGTDIVLGYFDREEKIPVVAEAGFAEEKAGCHTIYLDGVFAYVPEELVRMGDEETYAEWDGFSRYNATVYEDRWLLGDPKDRLNTNTQIRVLYELDNCYFVETGEVTGFIKKDDVSEHRFSTGSGGGDSGGNGGSVAPEWSPPVL